ncbi:MAG: hypothetical protein HY690_01945 [Chloroflexi bacterium]|nr:hypothetical protein [Chloroflexota bacterium]
MQCPNCDYQSPYQLVRCPHCNRQYNAAGLEKLAHLAYLRDRLDSWQDEGLLPAGSATALREATAREMLELERALGLRAATPEPAMPTLAAPAVAVEAGPGREPESSLVERAPAPLLAPAAIQPALQAEAATSAVAAPPAAPAPAAPSFSWGQVGTYLLSERTLNALLGLATLLLLASGVVISTLNPTRLAPPLHLGVVAATTIVFYVLGYVVRNRLELARTGSTLLTIGGAFVPLNVWTLGQEQLLNWEPGAIWLVASLVGLPLYLGSHAVLRDRPFALLTALAGGSELLAALNWLGVPLEWGLCGLAALGLGYLRLSHRLAEPWPALAWALSWSAQAAAPLVMALLMLARFFPFVWVTLAGELPAGLFEYAVAVAWWLGTAFYLLAARLFRRRSYQFAAAWALPFAYLFTLAKAPWEAVWYNLGLAVLALGYLAYGRWAQQLLADGAPPRLAHLLGQPAYQVGLTLTLAAAVWPAPSQDSRIATLFCLSLVYGAAAFWLRRRLFASLSVYLLPLACGLLLVRLGVSGGPLGLAWAALALALVASAEIAAHRSGEARRPLIETTLGLGAWRSRFASPLFLAGYATSLLALGIALAQHWNPSRVGGLPLQDAGTELVLAAIAALYAASAATRRQSFFLYVASWVLLLPYLWAAERIFVDLGWALTEANRARLLAALELGYLGAALALDRVGGHYAKPLYLAGYALSLGTMLLSALDRAANVQLIALSLLVYAASAWLMHRERHPSFLWLVERLCGRPGSAAFATGRSLFLYLAAWLFPAWLALAMSLLAPPPQVAHYGLALAVLAPAYVALGLAFRALRPEYRLPWYLGGYALSLAGPLLATPDPVLRLLALAISIALYAGSAVVFRQSGWLYPVALLTPLLGWQGLDRLGVPPRLYGVGLLGLALAYGGLGLALHHGSPRRALQPIGGAIGAYAQPFFVVGYVLSALGLGLAANQDRELVVLGFLLGGVCYAGSALIFRQSLFAYPLVATVSVAYVVGMAMTPLDARSYGLGLLPGLAAYLAIGDLLRRRLDVRWSLPFHLAVYAGTVATIAASAQDRTAWALAWWGVAGVYAASTALFRHPSWLYPTTGAMVVGYLATASLLAPGGSFSQGMVLLVVPTWLLFWLSHAVARLHPAPALPPHRLFQGEGGGWRHPWAAPLAECGLVVLAISSLGSAPDGQMGLRTAIAYAVLATVFAVLWRGQLEVWGSLVFAGVAIEHGLRLAGVAPLDQPPVWATIGLGSTLAAIAWRRLRSKVLALWQRPLYLSSIGLAGAAPAAALLFQAGLLSRAALQPLAITAAVSGLTLVAHGFDRRERRLGYLGVGLLELGYMIQLALFEVGQPQAFVLPAGLYLLAVAYLEWRRGTGAGVKPALESGALALLLGVSLLQAVGFLGASHGRYVYDTFLFFESLALFSLGAVLHWKRPFFGGLLALVVDVGILLSDPIRATNTWYLLAIAGSAMIGLVLFVERKRTQIPLWIDDWRQRLETWD